MHRLSSICFALAAASLATHQPSLQSDELRPAEPQASTQTVPGHSKKNLITDVRAKRIVEAMYDVYAKCKTYMDTGTYVSESTRMRFATRFKRPDRLYFEFTAKNNARDGRFVYWTTGVRKKIFQSGVDGPGYWDDTILTNAWYGDTDDFEKNESLGMTVAGFTGISMGTSTNVPGMIFASEVRALSLSDMSDLVVEGTAKDRGIECDVLYSKEHLTRAWIDKKSRLLRKMSERFEPSGPDMVTEYLPKINVEIKDALLIFKSPRS